MQGPPVHSVPIAFVNDIPVEHDEKTICVVPVQPPDHGGLAFDAVEGDIFYRLMSFRHR